MKLDPIELELIRQWFNAVKDLNPDYLRRADYSLYRRILNKLGMRVSKNDAYHPDEKKGPIPEPGDHSVGINEKIPTCGDATPATPCNDCDGNLCLSCRQPPKPPTCGECSHRGSTFAACQRTGEFVAADAAACSKFKRRTT